MNILLIGFFSSEGGISKNFSSLGDILSRYNSYSVFSVVGENYFQTKIPFEKERLILNINRKKIYNMFSLINKRKIMDFAKKNNIDIVYFTSNTIYNVLVSFYLKKYPQILFLHNPFPHLGTKIDYRLLDKVHNKIMVMRCQCIIVDSEKLKNDMKTDNLYNKYIDKVKVIPMSFQKGMLFTLDACDQDIDVFFFGRIEYYKGCDFLVDAFCSDILKNYKCLIVGKGMALDGKKLPENVKFINRYVSNEDIANFINRSKIVVLPYREASGSQIVQTVSFYKKAIICTDVGSFSSLIKNGDNGILIERENLSSLIDSIYLLLNNVSLRESLGNKLYEYCQKKFSPSRIALLYKKLFSEVVFHG